MIDWKRPYTKFRPLRDNGARYEQDGKQFNNRGEPIKPKRKKADTTDNLKKATEAFSKATGGDSVDVS